MTYYTIDFDIAAPARHKLTVPTGSDFAITINTYIEGRRAKTFAYKQGSSTRIISEIALGMNPADILSWLVDNAAYKTNTNAEAGLDCYSTLFIKGSDVEKSGVFAFWYDRRNIDNGPDAAAGVEMYNPKVYGYIDIQYVDFGKNCNGPDYSVQVVGRVSSKMATVNGLSVQYVPNSQGGMTDVLDITQNKARINGHLSEKYSMLGMQMNNNNGFFELSGNVCFDQDMASNATMQTASNVFFLDHFSKYVKVAELSVGEQVLSVLQVLPIN